MLRPGFAPLLAAALACAACASTPLPPPAASGQPIPLSGTHEQIEGDKYLEYRVGTNIAASPQAIWALLVDAEGYTDWNSTIISLEGPIEEGQRIKLKAHVDPKRTFKLLVSAVEPGSRMVWEDGNNAFRGVRTFRLTDRGDGTTDFTMAEVMTGSMMDMIAPKLPDFGPAFDAFAADLKAAAEAR